MLLATPVLGATSDITFQGQPVTFQGRAPITFEGRAPVTFQGFGQTESKVLPVAMVALGVGVLAFGAYMFWPRRRRRRR